MTTGTGEEQMTQGQAGLEFAPWVVPILLELPSSLSYLVDEESESGQALFHSLLPTMLQVLFDELGVVYPDLHVHSECAHLPEDVVAVKVKEVLVGYERVPQGKVFVGASPEALQELGMEGEECAHPANGARSSWVDAGLQARVEEAGHVVWSAQEYLILVLSCVLRRHAHRFVGIQEVHEQLEKLRAHCPVLVNEVVPASVSLAELTEVLRRLVEEEVSLRYLRDILEALAQWRREDRTPLDLVEWVRASLSGYLTQKHAGVDGSLAVYSLGEKVEYAFRKARKNQSADLSLGMSHEEIDGLVAAFREGIGEASVSHRPVILASTDIRRDVRQVAMIAFPNVSVLAHSELDFQFPIQLLGTIEVPKRKKK
jgi:type III secretion protein V